MRGVSAHAHCYALRKALYRAGPGCSRHSRGRLALASRPVLQHAARPAHCRRGRIPHAQEAGRTSAPEPARLLLFCSDSQEELCVAVWAFTAFIVAGVALSALSEAFEGILPLNDALLPNAVYRLHATLQLAWHFYGDQVFLRPVAAKAVISGFTYGLGDLVSQTLDKKHARQVNWVRTCRISLIGLAVHGPLSHVWFEQLDRVFIVSRIEILNAGDRWFVPLLKVALDQTLWAGAWNATFFACQGILQRRSPLAVLRTVRQTWWALLRGGWRVWPLIHLVTFIFVPREHRVLWCDTVELSWVVLISLHARQEAQRQAHSSSLPCTQEAERSFAESPEYDL